MFASKPSIKDFALKLPNVAVVTATADACATRLAMIESWSEVFGMRAGDVASSYSYASLGSHAAAPLCTTTFLLTYTNYLACLRCTQICC